MVRIRPRDLPEPAESKTDVLFPYALASCADIARTPGARQCTTGARTAWVFPDLLGPAELTGTWPAADVDPARLPELRALSLVVGTDGSVPAVERARTVIASAYPTRWGPVTRADWEAEGSRVFAGWKRLSNVVILASLVIAGLSLAVSVAGGLTERARPFSLLRLTGVSLGTLRRMVALESTTPLVSAAVVSVGAGFACAHLFLKAQMELSLRSPGAAYYVIVGAGLLASGGVIASTMPLLRRVTGPAAARNE